MKRLASHRWLLVLGVLVVVLSLGAVACGSSSEDTAVAERGQGQNELLRAERNAEGRVAPGERPDIMQRREAAKDRLEVQAERREALVDNLRADMSPEDQELFDQLKADIKEYRDALETNRQELADTLKQLRELTDKYLDSNDTAVD